MYFQKVTHDKTTAPGRGIYLLTQGITEIEPFISFIESEPHPRIDFICPAELTHMLGAVYWQEKERLLHTLFPHIVIIFWLEFQDTPGLVLGAFRMGVRHIIFLGNTKYFQKLESISISYPTRLIASRKEI